MTYSDFTTTTHGKWILAGEHAVIRGGGALVFPVTQKELTLSYQQSTSELSADYAGEGSSDMHLLFWSVLEQGMKILSKSLNALQGHFSLYNDIPVGVGMGASAALCVAMARWFESQGMLSDWSPYNFARELENLFHGQSSGLDIAGVGALCGIYFNKGSMEAVNQAWQPTWYLSTCGQIGITSHCINQVNTIWEEDPLLASQLDQQMQASVLQARQALAEKRTNSFSQLANAINDAAHCFQRWGLTSGSLQQHMDALYNAGAVAVKPTGSGGGGYVISLWESPPNLDIELIQI